MGKYKIKMSDENAELVLAERGHYLSHDKKEAITKNHKSGTHQVIQWVLVGNKGDSVGLTYENSKGSREIVKASKITKNDGIRASGAVFLVP
jgi:hypothetical protein